MTYDMTVKTLGREELGKVSGGAVHYKDPETKPRKVEYRPETVPETSTGDGMRFKQK